MRIFVTGGTGYIGSAVVRALLEAGHQVTGLVRTREKRAALRRLGAEAILGDLGDIPSYRGVASRHEAIIHMAFTPGPRGIGLDWSAAAALLGAASEAGEPRSLIYTSGTMVLGHTGGQVANEDAPTRGAAQAVSWRPAHEKRVLHLESGNLATAVIRPGVVYGGRRGLVSRFFASAVEEGAAVFIGSGKNRWPLVHRDDLARLYLLVVERSARGIFHGVDGAAIRVEEVARAASEAAGRGGATRSIPVEEARREMGLFADALCLDQVVGAARSRELGWSPSHPPFPKSARAAYAEWSGEAAHEAGAPL